MFWWSTFIVWFEFGLWAVARRVVRPRAQLRVRSRQGVVLVGLVAVLVVRTAVGVDPASLFAWPLVALDLTAALVLSMKTSQHLRLGGPGRPATP